MPKNAEAVAESTSQAEMTGDPTDAIAELLTGAPAEEKDEETEDSKDEETQSEESTESDESDEASEETEDESEEETDLEAIAEGDEATWSDVLGIDEDKLSFDDNGNVKGIKVKVNGEVSEVPMNDLVAGYQLNKNVTQKSQALSEEKKVFDEQKEAVTKQYNDRLNNVVILSNYLEKELVSEFEGINWDELRVQNPAEYAAARQDFAARAQTMTQIKEAAAQAQSESQSEAQKQMSEKNSVYAKAQIEKMIENNPTWSDDKVYEKDMGGLRDFCSDKYGFTAEDFKLVKDARLIELVKDASKYHAGVKLAAPKLKKKVPGFQKSKGRGAKQVSKLDKLTKQAREATGANKRELQTDAVATLLTGG